MINRSIAKEIDYKNARNFKKSYSVWWNAKNLQKVTLYIISFIFLFNSGLFCSYILTLLNLDLYFFLKNTFTFYHVRDLAITSLDRNKAVDRKTFLPMGSKQLCCWWRICYLWWIRGFTIFERHVGIWLKNYGMDSNINCRRCPRTKIEFIYELLSTDKWINSFWRWSKR